MLRRFDHIAIYLLIAGTYTPMSPCWRCTDGWRWRALFTAIWTLAAAGIALEYTGLARRRWLAALVYVGMGWIGLLAFGPLHAALAGGGVALVLAGGIAYTLGVPFSIWWRDCPTTTRSGTCSCWPAARALPSSPVLLYVLPLVAAPDDRVSATVPAG